MGINIAIVVIQIITMKWSLDKIDESELSKGDKSSLRFILILNSVSIIVHQLVYMVVTLQK